jgi:hypothetical protein
MLKKIYSVLCDPGVTLHCREPDPDSPKTWGVSRRRDKLIALEGRWKRSQLPYKMSEDPHPDTVATSQRYAGDMRTRRASTIVHEAAHLAGANRILSESYDREDCMAIARTSPFRAVRNADNYGWFVIDPITPVRACITEQEDWSDAR